MASQLDPPADYWTEGYAPDMTEDESLYASVPDEDDEDEQDDYDGFLVRSTWEFIGVTR